MTILCLLAAGFVVYLKRKTLIRLLFTDKKTTIEKLRYLGDGSSFPEMAFERTCNQPSLQFVFLSKEEVRCSDSETVVWGFFFKSLPDQLPPFLCLQRFAAFYINKQGVNESRCIVSHPYLSNFYKTWDVKIFSSAGVAFDPNIFKGIIAEMPAFYKMSPRCHKATYVWIARTDLTG